MLKSGMTTSTARILPIVLHPHPSLRTVCEPAQGATVAILEKLENMMKTLYRADGVGLAAPQVNILQRLVVMDLGEDTGDGRRNYNTKSPKFFINPEIVWQSEETKVHQEGCLSLPQLWADVERPAKVRVRYTNRDGAVQEEEADGLYAVCLQHEIDHLNGIVFPERLSRVRKDMAFSKWKKIRADWIEEPEYDALTQEAGVLAAKRIKGR
jgi:peptide deformylase